MNVKNKSIYVMQKELDKCIQFQEDMERAAIALETKSGDMRYLSDRCKEVAEDYRKEGTDWYMQIQEAKIQIERDRNV